MFDQEMEERKILFIPFFDAKTVQEMPRKLLVFVESFGWIEKKSLRTLQSRAITRGESFDRMFEADRVLHFRNRSAGVPCTSREL